jgi:hypothetical protein
MLKQVDFAANIPDCDRTDHIIITAVYESVGHLGASVCYVRCLRNSVGSLGHGMTRPRMAMQACWAVLRIDQFWCAVCELALSLMSA